MTPVTSTSARHNVSSGGDDAAAIDHRAQDVARTLRALVEASDVRSILVVGVDRGVQGLAARLANAEARAGRSTILVDADLRGPSAFNPSSGGMPSGGLAAWLLDEPSGERPAPSVETTDVPNLSVIRRGDRAPLAADALDGPRLDDLLPLLLRQADRVIVAGSPLSLNADALPFARRVDHVLLGISPGRTRRQAAISARDALRAAGGRIAGVVLDP